MSSTYPSLKDAYVDKISHDVIVIQVIKDVNKHNNKK